MSVHAEAKLVPSAAGAWPVRSVFSVLRVTAQRASPDVVAQILGITSALILHPLVFPDIMPGVSRLHMVPRFNCHAPVAALIGCSVEAGLFLPVALDGFYIAV